MFQMLIVDKKKHQNEEKEMQKLQNFSNDNDKIILL